MAREAGNTERKMVLSVAVVAIILLAAVGYFFSTENAPGPSSEKAPEAAMPPGVVWDDIYKFNKQGYEPSLVVDSQGYMYYTAHKNLDDKTTWDYLASWFFVGSPDGKTWASPNQPPIRGQKWKTEAGDEGDLAIDANDRVYYVDTYLIDNHLHVFDSPGTWQYSVRIQKTTGLDDRPWIAAQGNGICHYLGNNAAEVNGGRYWYYRSTDGGRIWSRASVVPGNGWGHIDAETKGTHAYIISESDVGVPADILVYPSSDSGVTWDFNSPVLVGSRLGPGLADGFPIWISSGTNGVVWCMWTDADDALNDGSRIFLGWSFDYGQNWNTSEITPWKGLFEYPTIDVGEDGTIAVAFYATESLPVAEDTDWFVYGAMLRPESPFHPANSNFTAQSEAMRQVRQYEANHTRDAANITGLNSSLFFNFTKGEEGPVCTGTNLHALHDFFECAVGPDGYLDVAYQHYVGPTNGASELYFVRGDLNATAPSR
jgi:hypothetical protein